MQESIWTATLAAFASDLAGPQPSPAAGSAASVSARLAVSLLIKVLEIAKKRKPAAGDGTQLDALIQAARIESEVMAKASDEDGTAFAEYLDRIRKKADEKTVHAAMLRAIEVPMTAARSSARALALSREAVPLVPTFIAADLGAAVLLLSGAIRALLITVDYNLRQLTADRSDLAAERVQLAAERVQLDEQSQTQTDAIIRELRLK